MESDDSGSTSTTVTVWLQYDSRNPRISTQTCGGGGDWISTASSIRVIILNPLAIQIHDLLQVLLLDFVSAVGIHCN